MRADDRDEAAARRALLDAAEGAPRAPAGWTTTIERRARRGRRTAVAGSVAGGVASVALLGGTAGWLVTSTPAGSVDTPTPMAPTAGPDCAGDPGPTFDRPSVPDRERGLGPQRTDAPTGIPLATPDGTPVPIPTWTPRSWPAAACAPGPTLGRRSGTP